MLKLSKAIVLMILWALLYGCALPEAPGDPNFAPVFPEVRRELTPDMGSIYSPNDHATRQTISLYEDIKARRVGDVITVVLSERTNAQKKAENKYEKKSDATITPEPTIFTTQAEWKFPKQLPIPLQTTDNLGLATNIHGDTKFEGTADAKQENQLTGTISVVVTQVYPNGNLFVRGEKWVKINDGDEFVRISGIIRIEDINPDNTIDSNRLADAKISYSGRGAFANSSKPGWLIKILTHPWWPI